MLIGSSIFSGIGLFLLSRASNLTSGIVAAVVFAVGVCFLLAHDVGCCFRTLSEIGGVGAFYYRRRGYAFHRRLPADCRSSL
jgi:hypothetical protein